MCILPSVLCECVQKPILCYVNLAVDKYAGLQAMIF